MTAGPYGIGSDHVPGLSKLIEECGEVLQVAGKIMGAGGWEHWQGDLHDAMVEELGDLLAAIEFFSKNNPLDRRLIGTQQTAKYMQFEAWHEEHSA